MTPCTVNIVCAKAPHPYVPAVRKGFVEGGLWVQRWECSWCGARVRVVA